MDYEEEYSQKKVYEKLYRNMALFGRTCFPTALNKEIPPFHKEVYQTLANPSESGYCSPSWNCKINNNVAYISIMESRIQAER